MREYFLTTERLGFSVWKENDISDALKLWGDPKNISSSRLLEKLGFTYTHDEFYPPTGLYHPSYLMRKQEYIDNKIDEL